MRSRIREAGSVFVETVLVLPLLLILLFGATDMYFAASAYFTLNHVAREAAVSMAALDNVVTGSYSYRNGPWVEDNPDGACLSGTPEENWYHPSSTVDFPCTFRLIRWRVRKLLQSARRIECASGETRGCVIFREIGSEFGTSRASNSVKVTIKFDYQTWFPAWFDVPLTVTATGVRDK